jgi:hypothetical protein
MRKPVKLVLAAAAAAIATASGITAASAASAASAAPPASHVPSPATSGTEFIQVMSASVTPGPASAIARGVFTAAGQARLGNAKVATIRFPGGTIVLSHRQAHGSARFSPASCLTLVSQSGSYRIVRGTGRYAGISGHGSYQLSLEIVAARANGSCSSTRPPLAQQELLRLSGPVRR